MIPYLLKSGVCLLVLLVFYKLALENQKLLHVNRFFLLASVAVSLLAPLGRIDVGQASGSFGSSPMPVQVVSQVLTDWPKSLLVNTLPEPKRPDWWLVVYGIVTGLLLVRLGRNLYRLLGQVNRHPTVPMGGATLVLLPDSGLPYTFLHYLFVDATAYARQTIEPELFTHELAHIRQQHSLDVLLMEGLLCFGWFNPLLHGYKRAIQLNHEFLADETVTRHRPDVRAYQRLLLQKIGLPQPTVLASSLTYQTTKQRFAMMTKQISPANALIFSISAGLLLIGLSVAASVQTLVQHAPVRTTTRPGLPPAAPAQPDLAEMERRFGNKLVYMPGSPKSRVTVRKRFSELSPAEKALVQYLPPQPRRTPTETEFDRWKNGREYGVWVDEQRTRNFDHTTLKASDIASYSGSYVHENASQPEGYRYQMDLMTEPAYAAYLKEEEAAPLLMLIRKPRKKP